MNQNAVFMVLTSMIRNFYCGLLRHKEFEKMGLDRRSRVKSFISKFLAVPAKWTRHARGHVLNLFTRRQGFTEIFNIGFD